MLYFCLALQDTLKIPLPARYGSIEAVKFPRFVSVLPYKSIGCSSSCVRSDIRCIVLLLFSGPDTFSEHTMRCVMRIRKCSELVMSV